MTSMIFPAMSATLAAVRTSAAQTLRAQPSSESTRIEQLEREIAELKREVNALKKERAPIPEGKMKTKITYDGKTYVEKAVVEEKPPVHVQQRGPESKPVWGGS